MKEAVESASSVTIGMGFCDYSARYNRSARLHPKSGDDMALLHAFTRSVVLLVVFCLCSPVVRAAASGAGEIEEEDIPIKVTEVAPGLYFQYHHQESNNAFLVTDEGVLLIDTRQHPKRAEELLATIRK